MRIGWAGSAFLEASGPDGRWTPQLQLSPFSPGRLKKAVTRSCALRLYCIFRQVTIQMTFSDFLYARF